MQLKDWLRAKGIPGASADDYARAMTVAGIADDEQQLPEVGLAWEDLKDIGVTVAYRQRILKAIREIHPPVLVNEPNEDAEARHDLIKRFVPIALSVGFAGRLLDIAWIKEGKPLDYGQEEQLARLLTGVFVAICGWEWYHRDLRWHPLNNAGRFFVDVAVVITTIIFLFSVRNERLWFGSLALIFLLYVVWDVLTIWDYPQDYNPATGPLGYQPLRGLITDFFWLVYFVVLAKLTLGLFAGNDYQTFIACLFVFLGALSLRLLPRRQERMSGWQLARSVLARFGIVLLLLLGYFVASIPGSL